MLVQQALIVDDNELNSEILATLLENVGIATVYLTSPRQLFATLATLEHLKVIFLDLEMPNYDGFELHRKIRADNRLAKIPVIAYTVHTSAIDRVRRAGFDGFLGKPIRPELFAHQIARILNNEPVWEVG